MGIFKMWHEIKGLLKTLTVDNAISYNFSTTDERIEISNKQI